MRTKNNNKNALVRKNTLFVFVRLLSRTIFHQKINNLLIQNARSAYTQSV